MKKLPESAMPKAEPWETPVVAGMCAIGFSELALKQLQTRLAGRLSGVESMARDASVSIDVLVMGPSSTLDDAAVAAGVASVDRGAESATKLLLSGVDPAVRDQVVRCIRNPGGSEVFFESSVALPLASLARLIDSAHRTAVDDQVTQLAEAGMTDSASSLRRHILTLEQELAVAENAEDVLLQLASVAAEVLAVPEVRCWCLGQEGAVSASPWLRGEDPPAATSGLALYALRTGQSCRQPLAAEDPRFAAEVDSPSSGLDAHVLVAPVALATNAATAAGAKAVPSPAAVLAADRPVEQAPFSALEQANLEAVARCAAPFLMAHLQTAAEQRRLEAHVAQEVSHQLYRSDALREHTGGSKGSGKLLNHGNDLGRRVFGVLLGIAALAVVLGFVVPVREYVAGPAVLRIGERTEIAADVGGTISQLQVETGSRVRAGQPLVHFFGATEAAEIELLTRAFEQQLQQRLLRPGDVDTAASLLAARTTLERAQTRLEALTLRAPAAGTISDLSARRGGHYAAGQVLMTLVTHPSVRSVRAFLPGHVRPKLTRGQTLRMTVDGFPHAQQDLVLSDVGEGIIGPAEGQQALGSMVGDSLRFEGALVLVESRLDQATFSRAGKAFEYYDGMHATVEILVGTEPLWVHLIPALAAFWPSRFEPAPESPPERAQPAAAELEPTPNSRKAP